MASLRSQQEQAYFDRLAEEAGAHWWGNRTPAGARRQDRRAALAAQALGLGPGRRVLELGCGAGDFSLRLAATGAQIVAVDVAPKLIELARRRPAPANLVFEVADVEGLRFEGASFDAVAGNSILHHVNLAPVLGEIMRLLCPGGRLFFTEPNMLNPQVWAERNIKPIGRWLQNSPDETAFLRWRLARALRRQGFAGVSVLPFDFLHPATPRGLIPAAERLGWLLERVPGGREFAGSLRVLATKPAAAGPP